MKRIPWNKGKKASLEARIKLSEAHKGLKQSKESREKKSKKLLGRRHSAEAIEKMKVAQSNRPKEWRDNFSKAKKGNKNPLYGRKGPLSPKWKGGITPINAKLRNSLEMSQWRLSVFERDDFTCKACGIRGGKLHAHHILAFSKFPDHRFDIDNGLTLCPPCHKKTDNYAGRIQ